MINKVIAINVAVVALVSSAAVAGLTDRMQSERMTVVRVDKANQRFFCAEHRHWTIVPKADAARLAPGDIVSVESRDGALPRVKVVRSAADELSSPE